MSLKASLRLFCLAALIVPVTPALIHACSCSSGFPVSADPTVTRKALSKQTELQFRVAAAVFLGRVEAIIPSKYRLADGSETDLPQYSVRFSVKTSFKGALQHVVVTENGTGAGDCSWGKMKVGEEYVVYGYRAPSGAVKITLCSGTHRVWRTSDRGEAGSLAMYQQDELKILNKLSQVSSGKP
jgi:hypothetical protein